VSARTDAVAAVRPHRPLAYLGGFFAFGIGVSTLYATTGVGFLCPFRWATGWDCPFCGATPMGAALLHGDLALAWAYNPLVLVGLVLLAGWGALRALGHLTGQRLALPPALGDRVRAVHPTRWLVIVLALGTFYTLARNLL